MHTLHFIDLKITLKVNTLSHLALFEALLSAIFSGEEDHGRRGERLSCLSAGRGRPRGGEQRRNVHQK